MFHHHEPHDRQAEEFVYRLMNDPACYERFVYTDTIDNYKNKRIETGEDRTSKNAI
jgi:hypothetical protein